MFCRATVQDAILRRLGFQLIDASSSIGANLEEAAAGETKRDFIHKNGIALKEARESRYWLRLITAAAPSLSDKAGPLLRESNELIAMLTTTIKRARSNPSRGPGTA